MADVEIKGLAELHKLLQELPAKVEANVMRGGLRAAGKVIEEEAKRLAPVDRGDLRDSIRASVRIQRRKGLVEGTVKAGGKKAWYARLVEFGTAAHLIRPKNRKSLFFAALAREEVSHPGAQKKPFMRPAFDSKAREAIKAMADYIRVRLPKELKKAGR
jgi:HK97 gp10 family phage protein